MGFERKNRVLAVVGEILLLTALLVGLALADRGRADPPEDRAGTVMVPAAAVHQEARR